MTAGQPSGSPARQLELVAVEVAQLAALRVRSAAGQAAVTTTKSSPTDVVTATDVESEALIRSELLARSPGSTIVGEELDDSAGTSNVGWIVDPIDGTVNFLYDLPVVSVSIAATLDGEVVAGAVADVHRGEVFSSTAGEGARLDGREITVNDVDRLDQALVGTGFSYAADVRASQAEVISRLLPACRDIRCMGSAALNLCWVGCGRLDAYFERDLKVYDYAAGALIAVEGGAIVERRDANSSGLTLAVTPGIEDSLTTLLGARPGA